MLFGALHKTNKSTLTWWCQWVKAVGSWGGQCQECWWSVGKFGVGRAWPVIPARSLAPSCRWTGLWTWSLYWCWGTGNNTWEQKKSSLMFKVCVFLHMNTKEISGERNAYYNVVAQADRQAYCPATSRSRRSVWSQERSTEIQPCSLNMDVHHDHYVTHHVFIYY